MKSKPFQYKNKKWIENKDDGKPIQRMLGISKCNISHAISRVA